MKSGRPLIRSLGLLRADWQERAECRNTRKDVFYEDYYGSERIAKAICSRCPVQSECLEFALATNEEFGIWGGLTPRERGYEKRSRRRAEAQLPAS